MSNETMMGMERAALLDRVRATKKALSVRQPWPWAMFHAGKDIENRDRRTHLRGDVLIHAGKQYDGGWRGAQALLNQWTWRKPTMPDADDLPRGGIVGIAEIVDCVSASESRWFYGTFGYVLQNAQPLPFIPCNGALGFFAVPDEAHAALVTALEAHDTMCIPSSHRHQTTRSQDMPGRTW